MNHHTDTVVWRAFETSAIARAIESGARRLRAAAAHSNALERARAWLPGAAVRPGHVLLSAALTHIALVLLLARPASWHWVVLPSIAAIMGGVLIACSPRARMGR